MPFFQKTGLKGFFMEGFITYIPLSVLLIGFTFAVHYDIILKENKTEETV